jgi:hypothetical protein
MKNEGYHEKEENLTQKTKDMHKAIVSLTEELEAIDWYKQRILKGYYFSPIFSFMLAYLE